jgi:hypothetical protein
MSVLFKGLGTGYIGRMMGSGSIMDRAVDVALERKVWIGMNPIVNPIVSPPVGSPVGLTHETGEFTLTSTNVSTVMQDTNAVITSVAQTPPASISAAVPAVAALAAILLMITRLVLTSAQSRLVTLMVAKGIPRATAYIIAMTAPWMFTAVVTADSPMVALYRINKLIGRIGLDDWTKLAASMRVEERNMWRARKS